jgi:predicted enzyme related to lactoylglutathione lyase
MASDIVFGYIAPVIPVRDLDAALARYAVLGFSAEPYAGGERYGFVARGGIHLHLNERHEHDAGSTSTHVYLYVSDADALHAEWAAAGSVGELSPLYDTEYGLREFSLIDPEGTLHRVGSPLSR